MVKFEFNLSEYDAERVFALKKESGDDHMTGNEYARRLLEKTLHRLHPERVKYDEETGEIVPRNKSDF